MIWVLGLLSLLALLSGCALWPAWKRGQLELPALPVLLHGGLGMALLLVLLLGFERADQASQWQLLMGILAVCTGAMLFGARRRERRQPQALLGLHLALGMALALSLFL